MAYSAAAIARPRFPSAPLGACFQSIVASDMQRPKISLMTAWLLAAVVVGSRDVDLADLPPTISLDLELTGVQSHMLDADNGHRICHTGSEYAGISHGGYPVNPNSCDEDDLQQSHPGRFEQSYAKHCEVSQNTNGAQNCPGPQCTCAEPTAQAFDHHEGQIDVIKTVRLLMRSDPRHVPVPVEETLADIDYALRGEYTLRYEAEDASGNKAENVLFAMVMLGKLFVPHDDFRHGRV